MAGSYKLWAFLVMVRFVWCVWPQMGYVDPAEFFEGPEVLAANIFGFEKHTARGYNTVKPTTTVFFPYITAGVGFHALKKLNELDILPINEHTLLAAPRVTMAFVSLITDACIYNICTILGLNAAASLIIYASSFVTLVFYTRNLTHAISAGTFALMLLLIVDSRKSQLAPRQPATSQTRDSKKGGSGSKKTKLISDPNHGFWLGVFVLEGTFNHPSFFIFSLIPMVFWLTGSATHFGSRALGTIISNIVSLLPGIITMAMFLIVLDSTFYGTLNPDILLDPRLLLDNLNADILNNLTIAPLNYLQYNFFDAKVDIQPKTTHLLFNLPLLYLPLLISFITEVVMVYSGRAGDNTTTFTSSTSRAFFALSFTTPLVVFLLLPIQEPKLLIPLLIPLVLLYADYVILPNTIIPNAPWIVWNTIFGLIFGVVLQGGVIPCLRDMKSMVSKPVTDNPVMYHFIFFHTPPPPQHLLGMPPQEALQIVGQSTRGNDRGPFDHSQNLTNLFKIHDLGKVDRMDMHRLVDDLLCNTRTLVAKPYKKQVYVIAPASLDILFCHINVKYVFKLVKNFTPHVSLDTPPFLFPEYTCANEEQRSYKYMGLRQRIPALFSLNMYRAELVRHFTPSKAAEANDMRRQRVKSFSQ